MSAEQKKLILVIGATGAQGQAVINSLLAPCPDGSPSPYSVRAFTRDINSQRAQELSTRGVECIEGMISRIEGPIGRLTSCLLADKAPSTTLPQ